MDLEELRAFLQVVDSGSFLAAADRLQVSRTTLRRRVGSLESRAGVPLLESTQQGVVLTDAGQMLARRGRAMEEEAGALLASVRDLGKSPPACSASRCRSGCRRSSSRRSSPASAGPIRSSTSRFASATIPSPSRSSASTWRSTSATPPQREVALVRRPAAPGAAARGQTVSRSPRQAGLARSSRAPRALRLARPGTDPRAWPLRAGGTFAVEPSLVSTDIHLVRHCCLAELGIGLVPDAMIPDPGFREDALVPVLPDLVGRERALRVTVPTALADIPKVKMVLDRVRGFLGEL